MDKESELSAQENTAVGLKLLLSFCVFMHGKFDDCRNQHEATHSIPKIESL